MKVFRISSERYSKSLSASGFANRWNMDGQHVIYTGSSRALSTLEMVVHRALIRPTSVYKMMVIELGESNQMMEYVDLKTLPQDWRKLSGYSFTQAIGSEWYLSHRSPFLAVPSAIIPQEYNYVINTKHEHFQDSVRLLCTEDYFWDERLVTTM